MEFHEKQQSPAPQYSSGPGTPISGPMPPHQPQPQPHMAYPQQPGSPPPVHMQQAPLSSGSPPPMQQQWSYGSGQMGTPPAQPPHQQQHQFQQQNQFQQQPPMSYAPGAGSQYQTAVAIPNLGMGSAPVDCPSCGKRGMTRTEYVAGNTTHVWAGVTFCFTLCLCFIPYMMNSLKDVKHHCGHCGVLLATWHKSGATEAHMHG